MGLGSIGDITKGLVPGHKDYLDFNGDGGGGGAKPRRINFNDPDNLFAVYDAYRLNQETGIGNEKRLDRLLRRSGIMDRKTGDITAPEGYDPSAYDPTGESALDLAERDRLRPFLKGGGGANLRQQFDEMRAELARKKMDQYKKDVIDPLTGSLSSNLQKMLDNPAISFDELNAWKGQAVSQARSQEAQRLNRLGASLGIRGLDPGSFTGAVLANRIAKETDQRISDSIRELDLSTAETERQSQMQELGLGTQVSTQLAQLETALTQGNLEQVFAISNNIQSLYAAMQQQDAAIDAQNKATKMGLYGALGGGFLQGAGSAIGG